MLPGPGGSTLGAPLARTVITAIAKEPDAPDPPTVPETPPELSRIRAHLAGHDLVCWCRLDDPCHADLLLRLANDPATSGRGIGDQ